MLSTLHNCHHWHLWAVFFDINLYFIVSTAYIFKSIIKNYSYWFSIDSPLWFYFPEFLESRGINGQWMGVRVTSQGPGKNVMVGKSSWTNKTNNQRKQPPAVFSSVFVDVRSSISALDPRCFWASPVDGPVLPLRRWPACSDTKKYVEEGGLWQPPPQLPERPPWVCVLPAGSWSIFC